MQKITRFRPERLPSPRAFYESALGELRRPSRGWAKPKEGCPFHPSKSKQSFSVNLETGGFYCFGCQAKGGDIVSFVMKRDGVSFQEAAKALGAWNDEGRTPKPRTVPVRFLVLDYIIDGAPYRAEVRDEPKTDLQRMRWIHAEAADRLTELRQGDSEKFDDEESVEWAILSLAWELIEMEVGQ
jgi:hypothetical protein